MPPAIDQKLCIKCGKCTEVCPVDVFYESQKDEYPNVAYGEDCSFCGACMLECPSDAVEFYYPLYAQPSYVT